MLRRDKEIRRFSLDGNFLIASRISVIVPTSISELVAHKVRFAEMRLSTHVISEPDFGVICIWSCRGQSLLARCQVMGVGFVLRKLRTRSAHQIPPQKPQVPSLSVFATKSDALNSSFVETTYERSL